MFRFKDERENWWKEAKDSLVAYKRNIKKKIMNNFKLAEKLLILSDLLKKSQ